MTRYLLLLALVLGGCGKQAAAPAPTPETGPVRVFAAASLTDVMEELKQDQAVELNVASSSTLAKQIEAGAPFDIFISANVQWMDELESKGLIREGSRVTLVRNRLAVIRPIGGAATLDKGFAGKLAVGDPSHVPAGIYAKQALDAMGLSPQLLPAADVRAALRYVELGEAELGIVYLTDAKASDKVEVVSLIDAALHEPVEYPAALSREASEAGEKLFAELQGEAARAVYEQNGFEPGDAP